jgi:3'(2'), 5'-bisphosphate nucleotidase
MLFNYMINLSIPPISSAGIESLYRIAQQAGEAILAIYADESLWHETSKSDDTPVTQADIAASNILVTQLPSIIDCPVVSEEALPSYEQRKNWSTYWLVDPMDGTREFIHKTGEFVINIALMHDHQPIFGLLYQPQTQIAWWGGRKMGAFYGTPGSFSTMRAGSSGRELIALGSRRSKWKGAWVDRLSEAGFQVTRESLGSALKFMRLAQGLGDFYPRLGPTSEWDTAAPQAILEQTGGGIVQWDGSPIQYGKEDTLNPHFVAVRDLGLLHYLLANESR